MSDDHAQDSTNPYTSPNLDEPAWFVWSRVPHALWCAWRGYRDEMHRTNSDAVEHFVVWSLLLLFAAILMVVSFSLFSALFPEGRMF